MGLVHNLYCFYGSLRKGHKNNILLEEAEYIETKRIPGYSLYDYGPFPLAVKTNNMSESITVELYKIHDYYSMNKIDLMEISAGYYIDFVTVGKENFKIFLIPGGNHLARYTKIPSGDWTAYCKMKGKK